MPTAATFQLDIISLTAQLWSGSARLVSLPGLAGRFGVMARHLPVLNLLREGMVVIRTEQGADETIYVSGGYVEVQPARVLVVADLAERNDDLDAARAQAARACADAPMAQRFSDENYAALHLELVERYRLGQHLRPK